MDLASLTTISLVSFASIPPDLPALIWMWSSQSSLPWMRGGRTLLSALSPEHQAPTGHIRAGKLGGGGWSPYRALGLGPSPCSQWG